MKLSATWIGFTTVIWCFDAASAQEITRFEEPDLVTTRQQIHINGSTLSYTARIGLIPIRNNDAGDVHGHFGFVSYSLDGVVGQSPRPVIFIWNGGPGANSTTVQFIGFGPKRMKTSDDAAIPTEVTPGLYDNDTTWLTFADLVFVDPVGTGFARPSKSEYASEFYNTLGDIASTAEFIRVFRLRFDLLDAPLFLAGESYGTWRASGAAELLQKTGIRIGGVILISGGLAMGPIAGDTIRTALFVPTRTATAIYHKRLSPELMRDEPSTLKEAEAWALEVYAPAWENRDSLNEADRDRIIADLAKYTGVPPEAIDRASLSMTSRQFISTLLKDRDVTLGRYDMRVTREAGDGSSRDARHPTRGEIIMQYFRNDLGFKTDIAYEGIESGWTPISEGEQANSPETSWNWNQGETAMASDSDAAKQANQSTAGSGDGPPGGSQPWMLRSMQLNPNLKLFVAAGKYDSLNSDAVNRWIVSQLDPPIAQNITLRCYPGGHIMYDTRAARVSLRDDIEAFVNGALEK